MARQVKLALIQQKVSEDIQENLKNGITAFEKAASAGAKLIVYPELAFTPFYPTDPATDATPKLAESVPGETTDIFSDLAKKWGVVTVINLFETFEGQTYDSSPVIDSDGSILGITRMAHILEAPHFHESGYYGPSMGTDLVYDTAIGKIGISICYDRHFPEYMRVLALQGAELVVVPQAGSVGEWPPGLFEAEMQVAGFQNGFFTALCNRVGEEKHLTFEGKSFVTAPDGSVLAQAPVLKDYILTATIDLDTVKTSHARTYFLNDRRPELYDMWHKKK